MCTRGLRDDDDDIAADDEMEQDRLRVDLPRGVRAGSGTGLPSPSATLVCVASRHPLTWAAGSDLAGGGAHSAEASSPSREANLQARRDRQLPPCPLIRDISLFDFHSIFRYLC